MTKSNLEKIAVRLDDDQILSLTKDKPLSFWKDHSLVISFSALALSIVTSLLSGYSSYEKTMQDKEIELDQTMRDIQDANLKQQEIVTQYGNSAAGIALASSINTSVNNSLFRATDLATELGSRATTAELIYIATGLFNLGNYESAGKLIQSAEDGARSANDFVVSRTMMGMYQVNVNRDLAAANRTFEEAENVDGKYDLSAFPYVRAFLHAWNQLSWADALAGKDCKDAIKHFYSSEKFLAEAQRVSPLGASDKGTDISRLAARQTMETHGINGDLKCVP